MINSLKNPSFLWPLSRPSSPVHQPTSALESHVTSSNESDLPIRKMYLSTFKRSSTPSSLVFTALIQDGSYLEMLSLRLSEAVSKALAQPIATTFVAGVVAGKRPLPSGRGLALGAMIESELRATRDSPHLHRAILRSLQRPLTVLLTNLSSILLPLISSPSFHAAPAPTTQSPNPTSVQVHALAIVTFVDELLGTFDILDIGIDVDSRGYGLKIIRDGLVSLVKRVITPLVTIVHKELVAILESLEVPACRLGTKTHPSLVTLQMNIPVYTKAVTRYTSSTASQATLATFLISIIWKGLLALAHRRCNPLSPPVSPRLLPLSPKRTSVAPVISPSKFAMKLPPSRPQSPSRSPNSCSADAKMLLDLLVLFPRPKGDKESNGLAREAVDDAYNGLESLAFLLHDVHSNKNHTGGDALKFHGLTKNLPLLIALPVILKTPVSGRSTSISVGDLIGINETLYRSECLSGFGRAEECATAVASRVLLALRTKPDVHALVSRWLELELVDSTEI